MADPLFSYLRQSLPSELAALTEQHIAQLERGEYEALLRSNDAQALLGHVDETKTESVKQENYRSWNDYIFDRLGALLSDRTKPEKQGNFFCIGYASLLAFLQSNVTGPPLTFSSAELLFSRQVASDRQELQHVRSALLDGLSMNGIAPYKLTPNIELLCLADTIFTCPPITKNIKCTLWARVRAGFLHQRLLPEVSSSLQDALYANLDLLNDNIKSASIESGLRQEINAEILLEKAAIHIHHGAEKLAQEDLKQAKETRGFDFALTGRLGKRTKFQEKDISQLVVLAKSQHGPTNGASETDDVIGKVAETDDKSPPGPGPEHVDLNDDTLLDRIVFSQNGVDSLSIAEDGEENTLPQTLASLDPSSQPQLDPIDSTLLLAFASSITNTSPADGLTREETLPYATRVLDDGSTNWQVYTQALLVRSRIEGYKPRTVERGLLQLQVLVDQVIADTIGVSTDGAGGQGEANSTTFLPRPKESESASVSERLRYIFQLGSPYRWDLEAELAARWIQLGGFRSALAIYERLEMWAEAALCWAATDREDKAKRIVRRQLFHRTEGGTSKPDEEAGDDEEWNGLARDPAPMDAPRLYCILGDVDQSPEMYEKAWEVSNHRYFRAQQLLGRYYYARKDFARAADAYDKGLKGNQLNEGSWFALGCVNLELSRFTSAANAFMRYVQLEEKDAEAWSNLAASLLRKGTANDADGQADVSDDSSVESVKARNKRDALSAFKRAAALKRDSYRIWENVLVVAASVSPPEYTSILAAQKSIVHLRGNTDGEKCIDVPILDLLVQYIISLSDTYDPSQPGIQRMTVKFLDESVVPLITGSADLWRLMSKVALWRNRPSSALDAEEKAWRVVTSQPGWETESEERWDAVVEATVRLCDSYESLGQRERTEGMGAGELVAKDWKFKARTAVKGIMGRGKGSWEGTDGWEKLKDALDGLRN